MPLMFGEKTILLGPILGTRDSLRQLNAIAVEGKNDREARESMEQQMEQLTEQARAFKEEGKRAFEESRQAHQAAARAQAHAVQEARQAKQEAWNDRWAREVVERRMSKLLKEVDAFKKQRDAALAETKRVSEAAAQAQARASREAQQGRQRTPSHHQHHNHNTPSATSFTMTVKECDSPYALSAALSDAGSKLVLINFHATWCGPSTRTTHFLMTLSKKLTGVVFLNVDVDENREASEAYEIEAMPTIMFVKNGEIIETIIGPDDASIVAAARWYR